jgi:hypothetical protein
MLAAVKGDLDIFVKFRGASVAFSRVCISLLAYDRSHSCIVEMNERIQ